MIPSGIPTIVVIVKYGKGGPNKDSIPIYNRIPPGTQLGHLKNDTLVRIVDPSYLDASRYRKVWNNSLYVQFNHPKINDDTFCEESGHLFPFTPEIGEGETETFQVISDIFQDGKRTIELRKTS